MSEEPASALCERHGDVEWEILFTRPAFINEFATIIESLSPAAQEGARKVFQKPPKNHKAEKLQRSLESIKQISLPVEKHVFELWQRTPESFWDILPFTMKDDGCELLVTFYFQIRELDYYFPRNASLYVEESNVRPWKTIARRFLLLALHDLHPVPAARKRRLNHFSLTMDQLDRVAQSITRKEKDGLIHLTEAGRETKPRSPLTLDGVNGLQHHLDDFRARGYQYSRICDTLEDGALFFLPLALSNTIWEFRCRHLGTAFDMATGHLRELGIQKMVQESGANELASGLRTYLKKILCTALEAPYLDTHATQLARTVSMTSRAHGEQLAKPVRQGQLDEPPRIRRGQISSPPVKQARIIRINLRYFDSHVGGNMNPDSSHRWQDWP